MNNLMKEEIALLTKYLPNKNKNHLKAEMCGHSPLTKINNGYLLTTEQTKYFGVEKDLLGQGTFGKVWNTTENYAYKYMDMTMEALKEISIMHYVDHPNLLCIAGMFETYVEYVIIMDEANVGTLYDMYDTLKKSKEERKKANYQILKGLAYLHSVYIVHCDIKPGNILVFKEGSNYVYKIGDFGISYTSTYVILKHNSRIVTEPWRPPEVFEKMLSGENIFITDQIDIWSVGVIIYDLIYQKHGITYTSIYYDKTMKETFKNIMDPNFKKIQTDKSTKFDVDEQALADWCLTIDPASRPTAMQCLGHKYFKSVYDSNDIKTIAQNDKSMPISVKNYKNRERIAQMVFDNVKDVYSGYRSDSNSEKVGLAIGIYAMTLFDIYFQIEPIPDLDFNKKWNYEFLKKERDILQKRSNRLIKADMVRFINLYLKDIKTDDEQKAFSDLERSVSLSKSIADFYTIMTYKKMADSKKKSIYEEFYGDIEQSHDATEYLEHLKRANEIMRKYYEFLNITNAIIYIAVFYIDPEITAHKDLNFLNYFKSVKKVLLNNLIVPTAMQYYTHIYNKEPAVDTLKKITKLFVKNPDQKEIVDSL